MNTELQSLIQECLKVITQDTNHYLQPFYRQKIYKAFGPANRRDNVENPLTLTFADKVFSWLAILAARYVLPIWQQPFPQDNLPQHLLATAEGVLKGTVQVQIAEKLADATWEQLEREGTEGERLYPYPAAFFVAVAANEALFTALGLDRWHDVEIRENENESDLDPWTSDSAKYSCAAFAGGIWGETFDSQKSFEFWEWWLIEAIPQAWQLATE